MVELYMVDNIGSNIKCMFSLQRQRLFPMSAYDFVEINVTIIGRVLDNHYVCCSLKTIYFVLLTLSS